MNWRFGRPASIKSACVASKIVFNNNSYSIQAACDLAQKYYLENDLTSAKQLLIRVAMNSSKHGDCWYQLALILNDIGHPFLAVAMAAHAYNLGEDYPHYLELKVKLIDLCKKSSPTKWLFFSILRNMNDFVRNKLISYFELRKESRALFIAASGYFNKAHSAKYISIISEIIYSKG